MSQFFQIHPENPQSRLIKQAAQIIDKGGIVAMPTGILASAFAEEFRERHEAKQTRKRSRAATSKPAE